MFKGSHCMSLAFSIQTIKEYTPVETEAMMDGVRLIIEDNRDFQRYEVTIKPWREEKDDVG